MIELESTRFACTASLFGTLGVQLRVQAILAGEAPARVFVDDPHQPRSALAWLKHRLYLAGGPDNHAFNTSLQRLFAETILPIARCAGTPMLALYYVPGEWERTMGSIVGHDRLVRSMRQYYLFQELQCDWRAMLPAGFVLRQVDRTLLDDAQLVNRHALIEEMCSERTSAEDFLAHSLGVCVVRGGEIAGWCLSEYNAGERCEIGIETVEAHRRQGLATAMASALIERLQAAGVTRIGWDCFAGNRPSVATALKVGFAREMDYPVYLAWL